jgi:hypothetical protein
MMTYSTGCTAQLRIRATLICAYRILAMNGDKTLHATAAIKQFTL